MKSNLKLVVNNDHFFFEAIKKEKDIFNKELRLVDLNDNSSWNDQEKSNKFIISKKAM